MYSIIVVSIHLLYLLCGQTRELLIDECSYVCIIIMCMNVSKGKKKHCQQVQVKLLMDLRMK